jgi:hypothetical protein
MLPAPDHHHRPRRRRRARPEHRGEAGWANVNIAGAHLYPVPFADGMLACACLCEDCYLNGACICSACECRKPLVWTAKGRARPPSLHVASIDVPGWCPILADAEPGLSMDPILLQEPDYGYAQEGYTDRCRLRRVEPLPGWLEQRGVHRLA